MPYGTIYSDTVQGSVAATAPVFRDGNSVEIGKLTRAWISFNGTAATVRGSFNTSSLTKNATGRYSENFTITMPDNNYAASITALDDGAGNGNGVHSAFDNGNNYSASMVSINQYSWSGSYYDLTLFNIHVDR
jgi:hypothetical protein